MAEDLEYYSETAKEELKQFYKSNNSTYWSYALTCFKSCVSMVPSTDKNMDILKNAQPNSELKMTLAYDETLFTSSDVKCLKACTDKLAMVEKARIDLDDILDNNAKKNMQIEKMTKDTLSVINFRNDIFS